MVKGREKEAGERLRGLTKERERGREEKSTLKWSKRAKKRRERVRERE